MALSEDSVGTYFYTASEFKTLALQNRGNEERLEEIGVTSLNFVRKMTWICAEICKKTHFVCLLLQGLFPCSRKRFDWKYPCAHHFYYYFQQGDEDSIVKLPVLQVTWVTKQAWNSKMNAI